MYMYIYTSNNTLLMYIVHLYIHVHINYVHIMLHNSVLVCLSLHCNMYMQNTMREDSMLSPNDAMCIGCDCRMTCASENNLGIATKKDVHVRHGGGFISCV